MPYDNLKDLPKSVKQVLPKHAQEIYRAAFNNAWDQYSDENDRQGDDSQEEVAQKVAWAAVKQEYKKAMAGEIPNFTGISAPYEEPEQAEVVIETDKLDVKETLRVITKTIKVSI